MELGIPKTNEELATMYGKYVVQQVRSFNRRPSNFEDILQSIWLKLVEGRVVERFHERIHKARPEALTTEEVYQHLGISTDSWVSSQEAYRTGESGITWMPEPVAGEATSLDALWSTDDVERYEETAYLYHEKVAASERLIPRSTPAEFRTYLQWAIHNAWANWCRTHSRRHKERLIDTLVRTSVGPEDSSADFDLFDTVTDPQMPTRRMEARVEVSQVVARLQGANIGPMQQDFFGLLREGYTPQEAARKLRLSEPTVRRITRVLHG